MLAERIEHDGFTYYQPVDVMDDKAIRQSMQIFEQYKQDGIIRAENYHSPKWYINDGVRQVHAINFTIDEIHFAQQTAKMLQCQLHEYQQAMRIVMTCILGYASRYLDAAARAMRRYADELAIPADYADGQIIADLLYLLPGDSDYRIQTIDCIQDIPAPEGKMGQQRNLAYYQTYLAFDRYLNDFWQMATESEKVKYFPVYFWYRVTGVIPLRPTECVLTPRNCIQYRDNHAWITLRRTTRKGTQRATQYSLDKDYTKSTYPIPDELADAIAKYIDATMQSYSSDIDVLFCKSTQFDGFGVLMGSDRHYTYANLQQCLSHYYREILCDKMGLTIAGDCAELSDDQIQKIRLGDTRHIALINLFATTRDPVICRDLAGHVNAEMSAHYSANRRQFLDAISYMSIRQAARRESQNHFLVSKNTPQVQGGRGFCNYPQIIDNDFTPCRQAVSPYGIAGECTCCEYYMPRDYSDAQAIKNQAAAEHAATSKLLFRYLQQFGAGECGMDKIMSVEEQLQAQERAYLRLAAVEKRMREGNLK